MTHVFHRLPWSEFTSVQSLMVMCQIESVVGNFLTLKFYLIFTPQCIGIVITNKQVVIFKTSFPILKKRTKKVDQITFPVLIFVFYHEL